MLALPKTRGREAGISMIEILMTLVVVTFGVLGLAALQGKAHTAQLEAYQRAQALILLQDMVSRIEGNSAAAGSYVTAAGPLGAGVAVAACAGTVAERDLCEWNRALNGASEVSGARSSGAMIEGRGCVEQIVAGRQYRVSVVWRGLSEITEPGTTTCGSGSYPSRWRRAVTTFVVIPDLTT